MITEQEKDYMLYMALLINKMHGEIYNTLSLMNKMPTEIKDNIFAHHLCNYDSMGIVTDIVKKYYPEEYNKKQSFNDLEIRMGKYLSTKKVCL